MAHKPFAIGKRARRAMGRYLRGNVDEETVLTTLASRTVKGTDFDEAVNERTLVSSIEATYTMSDFTPAAGVGPIMVLIAHSDYTEAEVEEFIENTGSWNEGDLVQKEVGQRRIRVIGIFLDPANSTVSTVLNDGRPIKTKLNWVLLQGQKLKLCGYNLGSAPIATTVPSIVASGHANLWP